MYASARVQLLRVAIARLRSFQQRYRGGFRDYTKFAFGGRSERHQASVLEWYALQVKRPTPELTQATTHSVSPVCLWPREQPVPGKPARWSEILDRRSHSDTNMTTVLRVSESAVVEVVEKMVGDTGIEPVASSV